MSGSTVGFVGAGFHARTNLLPAASVAAVEIAGLATRDAERSAAVLAAHGMAGRGYGSVAAMVQDLPDLDRVIVCAQPADQSAIVEQLLEAGLHVLAEKPLGGDAVEARALLELAEANGVVLRAAFMKRHAPATVRLKELLGGGDLGSVLSFAITFGADTASFAPTTDQFLRLAAIHHVDLLRHLLGEPELVDVAVAAAGAASTVLVTVRTRSGSVGVLRLTSSPGHTSEVDEMVITCERGTLTMVDTREITVQRAAEAPDWRTVGETLVLLRPATSTMSGGAQDLVLRGFVDEVRSFATEPLDGTGDDAGSNLATMRLVDEIARKARAAAPGPPPIAFGPAGPVRDAVNTAVLSGRKTSSSDLRLAYEAQGQPLPRVGDTRVLLGSDDEPVASLHVDQVSQRRLVDVDEAVAALEGRTLDGWHDDHRTSWATLAADIGAHLGADGWTPSDHDVVVTTVFRAVARAARASTGTS